MHKLKKGENLHTLSMIEFVYTNNYCLKLRIKKNPFNCEQLITVIIITQGFQKLTQIQLQPKKNSQVSNHKKSCKNNIHINTN